MIQRIQTVYLFFVFCLMLALPFVPFSSSWLVSLDAGIVAFLAGVTVFLYKNRSLQMKISGVILFLSAVAYGLYFVFDRNALPPSELFVHIRYSFTFPLIAFVFTCLAIRGMKKDEKLIRSTDRLR